MNFFNYIKAFENVQLAQVICRYCGSIAYSYDGKEAICHFCENHADADKSQALNDPVLSKKLNVQLSMGKSDWEGAAKAADALATASADPYMLFFGASIYRAYSDYKYYDRDYNLMGYMEQNSANVYASLDFTSKSKEYFYKAIKTIDSQPQVASDASLQYTKFISLMRLGRVSESYNALAKLREIAATGLLTDYAGMVYSVEMDSKDVEHRLNGPLAAGHPNAFYYLARRMIKQKKLDDAERVLEMLQKKVSMPMAFYLLGRVRNVKEQTKL